MTNLHPCDYDTYELAASSFMLVISFFTVGVGITFLNRFLNEETDFRITSMTAEITNLQIINDDLKKRLAIHESEEGYEASDSYEEEKTD